MPAIPSSLLLLLLLLLLLATTTTFRLLLTYEDGVSRTDSVHASDQCRKFTASANVDYIHVSLLLTAVTHSTSLLSFNNYDNKYYYYYYHGDDDLSLTQQK